MSKEAPPRAYAPIGDYGVIGDKHSAALISADGSIDWACLPYFDSPAVFLRLLDWQKGGYCAIRVDGLVKTSRCYLGGTNILQTTLTAKSGSVVVTDFMPVRSASDVRQQAGRIIRFLRCTSGSVDLSIDIKPTFGFASEPARIHSRSPDVVVFEGRDVHLLVEGPNITIRQDAAAATSACRLNAGDTKSVTMTFAASSAAVEAVAPIDPASALKETQRYWAGWSGRLQYQGDYKEVILRSILTLKLLTFAPASAIVAAPTTSLPEIVGGGWNWDYRLSWIRDSQFVLTAFMHCGYFEEAHRFFQFLKKAASGPADQMQILYTIRGERAGREIELDNLEGYRHSRPVRVGNAAGCQKQSDIYGELLNCMYVYCHKAASETQKKERANEVWPMAQSVADYVTRHWREPDQGIWELRTAARQYVHSKAMCWTALDRAIRLAAIAHPKQDTRCWQRERDTVFESIAAHGFNTRIGAFVQSYGSDVLDAAVLRLPLQGVIDAADPRVRSTVEQLERRLLNNGLLYRYGGVRDVPEEGAFTSCTLWLINYYVLIGHIGRARGLLDHLLSFQNDLGLFAEEINPSTGEQLGNFPQALTHVALISAICHLEGGPRPGALQLLE